MTASRVRVREEQTSMDKGAKAWIFSHSLSHYAFFRPLFLISRSLTRREARVGIEPTHTAFAEPRLTTWLPRLFDRERLTYAIARRDAKQKFLRMPEEFAVRIPPHCRARASPRPPADTIVIFTGLRYSRRRS